MKNSSINRSKGSARELKGRIKEGFGEATNNPDVEARGKMERLGGKAQRKLGEVERVLED
jgi:uncharacterized protein YjbJ (UPF0337 family)